MAVNELCDHTVGLLYNQMGSAEEGAGPVIGIRLWAEARIPATGRYVGWVERSDAHRSDSVTRDGYPHPTTASERFTSRYFFMR
jgi:hypothetical protein